MVIALSVFVPLLFEFMLSRPCVVTHHTLVARTNFLLRYLLFGLLWVFVLLFVYCFFVLFAFCLFCLSFVAVYVGFFICFLSCLSFCLFVFLFVVFWFSCIYFLCYICCANVVGEAHVLIRWWSCYRCLRYSCLVGLALRWPWSHSSSLLLLLFVFCYLCSYCSRSCLFGVVTYSTLFYILTSLPDRLCLRTHALSLSLYSCVTLIWLVLLVFVLVGSALDVCVTSLHTWVSVFVRAWCVFMSECECANLARVWVSACVCAMWVSIWVGRRVCVCIFFCVCALVYLLGTTNISWFFW